MGGSGDFLFLIPDSENILENFVATELVKRKGIERRDVAASDTEVAATQLIGVDSEDSGHIECSGISWSPLANVVNYDTAT